MNCADVERYLDDFVDGALPAALAAELGSHVASCPSCREAESGLRALLAEAESLDASIEPPRDLWAGIARRIDAEGAGTKPFPAARPAPRRRRAYALLGAAAALAVGIAGALGIPALSGSAASLAASSGAGRRAFAYRPRPMPASFKASPGLAKSQAAFEAARAELYAALEARRPSLSPDTARVIERNLRIIDEASREIEAALEKDPDNQELSSFLITTYESEIRTLRQAALQPGGI